MQILFIFLMGISIGSFLNVCIYRLPLGMSIIKPNSHCFNCKTELKFRDMVPVFGYFLNRGKCRYCGEKYSIRYSLIELVVGVFFVVFYLKFSLSLKFFFNILIFLILLIIIFIDLDHMIIPDGLNLIIFCLGISYNIYFKNFSLLELIIGFLIGGGIFFIIALLGPMGGGDIKLMAALGFVFGPYNILIIMLLSFILGGIIGIILILLKKKTRKDYIPFGPFIAISAILVLLYGDNILEIYLRIIGW